MSVVRAMRVGASGLRDGHVLMLFPEGERSIDGSVKRFKKGAAILASNVPAPVIPISIVGAYDVWPRGGSLSLSRLLPFVGRVVLRFGEPLRYPDEQPFDYTERTATLRGRVSDLFEQD